MGRFVKGQSGNPAGRKKGVLDRRTQARELFAQHRDELIATAIRLALSGDATALRMCLDRVVPALKPAATALILPPLPSDLAGQGSAVLSALGAGEITPEEAATVIGALAQQARIVETTQLDLRISALEEAASAKA